MMDSLLLQRLQAVGIDDVLAVDPLAEGMAAVAGLVTRRSGTRETQMITLSSCDCLRATKGKL